MPASIQLAIALGGTAAAPAAAADEVPPAAAAGVVQTQAQVGNRAAAIAAQAQAANQPAIPPMTSVRTQQSPILLPAVATPDRRQLMSAPATGSPAANAPLAAGTAMSTRTVVTSTVKPVVTVTSLPTPQPATPLISGVRYNPPPVLLPPMAPPTARQLATPATARAPISAAAPVTPMVPASRPLTSANTAALPSPPPKPVQPAPPPISSVRYSPPPAALPAATSPNPRQLVPSSTPAIPAPVAALPPQPLTPAPVAPTLALATAPSHAARSSAPAVAPRLYSAPVPASGGYAPAAATKAIPVQATRIAPAARLVHRPARLSMPPPPALPATSPVPTVQARFSPSPILLAPIASTDPQRIATPGLAEAPYVAPAPAVAVQAAPPAPVVVMRGDPGMAAGMPVPELPQLEPAPGSELPVSAPPPTPAPMPAPLAVAAPPPAAGVPLEGINAPAPVPVAQPSHPAPAQDPSIAATTAQLTRVLNHTGLSDAQVATAERARIELQLGRVATAHSILTTLEAQLTVSRAYRVAPNEHIADISARSDVYGNRYLWPLLWRANLNQLKHPEDIHSGMQLQVPTYPTVSEVADALDYSHSNPVPR